MDLRSGSITGVEALVRWQHPTQGLVPPARFIPLAEQTAADPPARATGCCGPRCGSSAPGWTAGYPLRMAVNLSAPQFEQADLSNLIARALIDTCAQPDHLELEITESTAMGNPDATTATLQELKAIGVHVSIDDFGTGYSSLAYLKRFPIDALKIDRSFVRDLGADPDDATIARTIIGLARSARPHRGRRGRRDPGAAPLPASTKAATRCRATSSAARSPPRRWRSSCARTGACCRCRGRPGGRAHGSRATGGRGGAW